MKKILLITLILILQSIPSFGGSLDGTYLMCKNIKGYYKIGNVLKFYVGISFENNKLRRTDYHIEKDETFLNTTDFKYETDHNHIIVPMEEDIIGIIQRESLVFTINDFRLFSKNEGEIMRTHYECSIINGSEFSKEVERIQNLLQSMYNEKMKDNKI